MSENVNIVVADYTNPKHCAAISLLMELYSGDVMGGGEALPVTHCLKIPQALNDFGNAVTVLAFSNDEKVEPLGIATSIKTFSTFMLKPILNLHDVFVVERWRAKGVAMAMLNRTVDEARERDCCKLTLEVLGNNKPAKKLYQKLGFHPYQLLEGAGTAEFWQKRL